MKQIIHQAGRLIASILTMALLLSMLSMAVFADESTYSIVISGAESGHTFYAYQVFSGTLSTDAEGTEVLEGVLWGKGVDETTLLGALQSSSSADEDGNAVYPFQSCDSAAAIVEVLSGCSSDDEVVWLFVSVLSQYLSSNRSAASYDSVSGTYTFSGLSAGYYLIVDSTTDSSDALITLSDGDSFSDYMLVLVSGGTNGSNTLTISVKAVEPTVEKKVYEESVTSDSGYGTGYNDVADYDIGDTVTFHLIAGIPALTYYETYELLFHDTLSDGLTLDYTSDSTTLKVYLSSDRIADESDTILTRVESTAANTSAGYVVTIPGTESEDTCSFEVSFSNLLQISGYDPSSACYIIVEYTATLNENAVIGLDGNTNRVRLEYSNNPSGTAENATGSTPEDTVVVFTYELELLKVDAATSYTQSGVTSYSMTLSGAQFVLYVLGEDGTTRYYAVVDSETGLLTGFTTNAYDAGVSDGESRASLLTTGEDGTVSVIGLDEGEYYIEEITAPSGYNLLESAVPITISAGTDSVQDWDGDAGSALTGLSVIYDSVEVSSTASDLSSVTVTIENGSGSTLPSTGGSGTTMLYVIGTILTAGAAALLLAGGRRRT